MACGRDLVLSSLTRAEVSDVLYLSFRELVGRRARLKPFIRKKHVMCTRNPLRSSSTEKGKLHFFEETIDTPSNPRSCVRVPNPR